MIITNPLKNILVLFFALFLLPVDAQNSVSTKQDNVHILQEDFYIPQLERNRRIWIYLPLEYTKGNNKYPVIYLHDGQNLFDKSTSYIGEWNIDETLNEVEKAGYKNSIVVGIDNGGEKRIDELAPFVNKEYNRGGEGDRYMDFITHTLKPYIDSHYRTKKSRKNTTLGGSSLGALISVYGAVKHPETYGKIIAFSPAFWFNQKELANFIENSSTKKVRSQKYYFLQGAKESDTIEVNTKAIIEKLKEKGLKQKNYYYFNDPDGAHNEAYWSKVFKGAYLWLN